ncbi:MAG: MAPEG family protein [Betaproteobacteria bacterium]|nr:MAPEG family protein [Betaproteobacteria bacterium]
MQSLKITLWFIGVFAVIQVPLTLMVGLRRATAGIGFLDGGDKTLLRRMRAHGNYIENVPMIVLVLAAAELCGAPAWALWTAGGVMLGGRLLHVAVMFKGGGAVPRGSAMLLTLLPMLALGVTVLVRLAGAA